MSPLLGYYIYVKLVELCLVDIRGRVEHHIAARVVLGERYVVADRLRSSEQGAQTVESERQSSVGRAPN